LSRHAGKGWRPRQYRHHRVRQWRHLHGAFCFARGTARGKGIAKIGTENSGRAAVVQIGGTIRPPRFIATLMIPAVGRPGNRAPIHRQERRSRRTGRGIGCEVKGCKTGIATDLTISVASGTRFLNEFDVPEPAPSWTLQRIGRVQGPSPSPAYLRSPGLACETCRFSGIRLTQALLAIAP